MPLAGAGDLLSGDVFDFGCYSFHGLSNHIKPLQAEAADIDLIAIAGLLRQRRCRLNFPNLYSIGRG
jgi:hypothetical protein